MQTLEALRIGDMDLRSPPLGAPACHHLDLQLPVPRAPGFESVWLSLAGAARAERAAVADALAHDYQPSLATADLIVEVRRLLASERRAGRLVCRYLADLADRIQTQQDAELVAYVDELQAAACFFELGARETRERVRIGRALRQLPRLEEAFIAGEVSYSRVREVTRVADPASESAWLELARRLDMRELERRVAGAASKAAAHGAAAHEAAAHEAAAHEAGGHGSGCHEAAAHGSGCRGSGRHEGGGHGSGGHEAAARDAGGDEAGARTGAPEQAAVEHAAVEHAAVEHAAVEHAAIEHAAVEHAAVEHAAVEHAAVEHAAVEPGADACVDFARRTKSPVGGGAGAADTAPADSMRAPAGGSFQPAADGAHGLHTEWVSRDRVRVSVELTAEAWALVERALEGARRSAQAPLADAEALEAIARDALAAQNQDPDPSDPRRMVVVYECQRCGHSDLDTQVGPFELPAAAAATLACGAPEVYLGSEGRSVARGGPLPVSVRRAVLLRDRCRCRVPGCRRRRYVDVHHLATQPDGSEHSRNNCVTLCNTHHRRLHDGHLQISGDADADLAFHGAALPATTPEVANDISSDTLSLSTTQAGTSSEPALRVLASMGRRGHWSIDELLDASALPFGELQHALLLLQLDGRVRTDGYVFDPI